MLALWQRDGMSRLFIRIFGWFWLTIIIIMTATYWISSAIFEDRGENTHLERVIDHYFMEIEDSLISRSMPEFLEWLDIQRFPRDIAACLEDEQGSVIAAKGLSEPILRFYQTHRAWPFESSGRFLVKQKSIYKHQALTLSVMLLPGKHPLRADHSPPWFSNFNKRTRGWGLFRLVIALSVSALVCYLLARYLSNPITQLRNTVKSLGKGDFKTNISAQFGNRKDEISELAIDIDEMASKLREQFRIRENLLRDISHELRSPLARMHIATELIKSKSAKPELQEIAQLESDIVLIDKLIGEIITFSRLSDNHGQYEYTDVDIRVLLDDLLKNANFEAVPQNKRVLLTSNDSFSYELKANKALMRRALENIIRNAIKYTAEQTSVQVNLDRRANLIDISISDEGPGVDEEHLEKIFEPFYRISDSRSRQSGGSGLGLAITRRAIEMHRGSISARNSKSGGLIVSVRLPVSDGETDTADKSRQQIKSVEP